MSLPVAEPELVCGVRGEEQVATCWGDEGPVTVKVIQVLGGDVRAVGLVLGLAAG
jgi:hypothetical protein